MPDLSRDVPRWQQWHKRHYDVFLRGVIAEQEGIAVRLGFHGVKPGRPVPVRERAAAEAFCERLTREAKTATKVVHALDEYVTKHEERLRHLQQKHQEAVLAAVEIERLQQVLGELTHGQHEDDLELNECQACIDSMQTEAEMAGKLARDLVDTQQSVDLWRWRRERAWVRLRHLVEHREMIRGALEPL